MRDRMPRPLDVYAHAYLTDGISTGLIHGPRSEGVTQATALELSGYKRLGASLSLESLRGFSAGFQPPQFFARLKVGTPLMGAICNAG